MRRSLGRFVIVAVCATYATSEATVLCVKKSGVIAQRSACKRKEKPLDLAQFGVVGPKGDQGDPGTQGAPGVGPLTRCPPDSVLIGTTCVDKYEASVWQISLAQTALIDAVKAGTATLTDLQAGGAVQLGATGAPFNHTAYPTNFPEGGNWSAVLGSAPPSPGVYAASVAGVLPTTSTTQLQAAQACALAGKHLIRNDEWQLAVAGTPDPGSLDDGATTCATNSSGPAAAGARTGCVSAWGAHDLVGNVWERVADWMDQGPGCTDWTTQGGPVGSDMCCFGGGRAYTVPFERLPGAPVRGGEWDRGAEAGVFAIDAYRVPFDSDDHVGFRCAR